MRRSVATAASDPNAGPEPALALESFLPYRLSVATNRVSRALARVYARRFGLSVPEWRVIAVLARFPGLSARELEARTEMDKVAISRAVARLLRRQLLRRSPDPADGRRLALALSPEGEAIYREIVPLALRYQEALTASLSAAERQSFLDLLGKLDCRARELASAGPG